jgi:ChrR Cupin-like domain
MTEEKTAEADAFMLELRAQQGERLSGAALSSLSDLLAQRTPSPLLRAKILEQLCPEERFARFAPAVAEILDLDRTRTLALLQRVDDPSAWFEALPGVAFLAADGGPRARGALRAFVRVRAGVEFPQHEHLGDEAVLIMQGHYRDNEDGAVYGPGDVPNMPVSTSHSFRVLEDGPDLLGLVVAYKGLRAQGQDFLSLDEP